MSHYSYDACDIGKTLKQKIVLTVLEILKKIVHFLLHPGLIQCKTRM